MDYEAEPPPGGTVRLDWLEPLSPQVTLRYRIPGVGHPDRPVFDVIADLLGGSDGLLADQAARAGSPEAAWSAGASQSGSPGRLSLGARPGRDQDLPALEPVALAAVERLRNGEIDPDRLARIRREYRFAWEQLRSDRGDLASEIGDFSVQDEWRTMRTYFEHRMSATPEEIQRVARRYLVPWNLVIGTTRETPIPAAEGNLMGSETTEDR
jgi:predicted Zn-dependent peptidase